MILTYTVYGSPNVANRITQELEDTVAKATVAKSGANQTIEIELPVDSTPQDILDLGALLGTLQSRFINEQV
jgi:hypothetical protein